ncbi:MAG: redoxin domain-containing protein [Phycisphaerales bacterium]|nr:MAG: redoxin domain-containing protein [Phycisphaerales bacterium]
MKWASIMLALAVVFGLVLGSSAVAEEKDASSQITKLEETQAQLQQEITDLKEQMKALQAELTKLSAALKGLQAAQKPPSQQRQRPAMELLGKPAPEAAAATYDGKEIKIGGKPDKPQVLFFYASWCGYSKRAMPGINSLHEKYKDKGVDVVAISMDARSGRGARTPEQILQQYNDLKLSLPMTLDPERKIGGPYKATSFPTLFVVGQSGEVEAVHIGAKADLESKVAQELDLLLQGKTREDFPDA